MIERIKRAKKVVLLEPPYKRKYPPLGLAKIGALAKKYNGETVFQRKYMPQGEDLVCVTSLFTYDSQVVLNAIAEVKFLNPKVPIIVGGVYATLMGDCIKDHFNVDIFKGYSKELDMSPPDFSFDWQVEKPWDDFSFVFTSRGCPNKCSYCAVWKLEPDVWINPEWKKHMDLSKPNVMISDNNLSAQPIEHIEDVCNFLITNKKKVIFDNGLDCKHITRDLAVLLGQLKFMPNGMRLAFDRIEEDGIFQEAVELLKKNGVSKNSLMAYVLFNFNDTPREAIYRMEECIRLKIRPYPQRFTPLNCTDRKRNYVGKHWTENLVRAFRFFYLMAGYYTKYKFYDWILAEEIKEKYKLNREDFSVLRGKK